MLLHSNRLKKCIKFFIPNANRKKLLKMIKILKISAFYLDKLNMV